MTKIFVLGCPLPGRVGGASGEILGAVSLWLSAASKPARAGIWFDEAAMSPDHATQTIKGLKKIRGLRLVSQERNPVYSDDGTLLGYQEVLHFRGDNPPCFVIQTLTPKKRAST